MCALSLAFRKPNLARRWIGAQHIARLDGRYDIDLKVVHRCKAGKCRARIRINNAGEMNGFLKPRQNLFAYPKEVNNGAMVVDALRPRIDTGVLAGCFQAWVDFGNA